MIQNKNKKYFTFKAAFSLFLLLGICFTTNNISAVVAGISCIENKESKQKVILLHDRHDMQDSTEPAIKKHQQELNVLINVLSARTDKCSFYIEYPYNTTHFKGTYDYTTIHTPIKDALAHNMQHGSITYKPFDERTEDDFWVREMFVNTENVQAAIENKSPIPQEFKAVTLEAYLQSLQKCEKVAQELTEQLSTALQKNIAAKLHSYQEAHQAIQEQMHNNNIGTQEHIFSLVTKLAPTAKKKLFVSISQAQSASCDISLLHKVINNSSPLSVFHAGAYHTDQLETALAASNFHDAFPNQQLKNNLDAHDLHNIIWPTTIPSSFVTPVYAFLSLCNNCKQQTTIKCSACKKAFYCTRECQKNDWGNHKLICKKVTI